MKNVIYPEESYAVQGAMFEVYREMGNGFLEAVYQECLEKEFSKQNINFIAQPVIELKYKGEKLKQFYRPDFICFNKIIVELKAVNNIVKEYEAQLQNYLYATGLRLGIIANFGHYPGFEFKRIAL
ncbi:MAG: GxxExxY protein [Sedimentisphaeraceae bacterium JB056]